MKDTARGKKGGNTVRIPIVAQLDAKDERERYLAHVLRHGIYVDEKKVQFLKGAQLLEYLAFLSLSKIDKEYLKCPGQHNVIKFTAESLKGIML